MWLLASCLYLPSLLEAGLSAAAPAVVAMSARCELAYVSSTVTSHALVYYYYYYMQAADNNTHEEKPTQS